MFKNYVKIAFRNIVRHKGYSFINIVGLAIGLTVCILIMLWVQDEYSRDRYHENLDNIYRVCIRYDQSGGMRNHRATPPALGPALKDKYPGIVNYARYSPRKRGKIIKFGDQLFKERIGFADPSLFEIFTIPFIKGNLETAFNLPFSAVITERMADKFFGERDPIGQVLTIDNLFDLTITGVIKNIPTNSLFDLDIYTQFASLSKIESDGFLESWGDFGYQTYVSLEDISAVDVLNPKIHNFLGSIDSDFDIFLFLQSFRDIHLYGLNGDGTITQIYIFSTTAIFVLLIACINFMNLSTARSIKRAKEIGLRKVVGASRYNIRIQFLGESIIFSLLALLLAITFTELLLPVFNDLSGKQLYLALLDNNLFLAMGGLALITGLLSGIYPALFLSSFKPARVLKGIGKFGSPLFRKVMVTSQFALSIILIVSTILVSNQLDFLRNKNLGFNRENIVYIPMNNGLAEHYESFRTELSADTDILSVTATSNRVGVHYGASTDINEWEGNAGDKKILLFRIGADYDFDKTFGTKMVSGRFFSKDIASDTDGIILNETAVKAMGMENPIGKIGPLNSPIIGVIKDFNFHPLNLKVEPMGIFIDPDWYNYIAIKIKPKNIPAALAKIEDIYHKFSPQFPFEFRFLDDYFDELYRSEQRLGILFSYFSALAIIISCLGLFGLATYSAEQRTKEIGIRKVLGASVPCIINLLSKEFILLVGLANLIAWPIAYYAMSKWLQDFAYHISIEWWVFLITGAGTLIITLLTVGFKAAGAARADPVETLKYE